MHLILVFAATAVGLWAGFLGTVLLLLWLDVPRWPTVLLAFPIGFGCAAALHWWTTRCVAVKCPSCGGRAFYETKRQGSRDRIRYRCTVCKDVHPTAISEGR